MNQKMAMTPKMPASRGRANTRKAQIAGRPHCSVRGGIGDAVHLQLDEDHRRIARTHGWRRTGVRIRAQIEHHMICYERTQEPSGDWPRRNIDDMATAEILSVLRSGAALLEGAVLALARRSRHLRLTASIRERLEAVISGAAGIV